MTSESPQIAVRRFVSLDSTSLEARRAIEARSGVDLPTLVVAETQTGGRGRMGRSWASPKGGLWCTLLWPLPHNREDILAGLGLRIGLATVRAVNDELDALGSTPSARLKWPNDVLLNRGKVAGALTEIVHRERCAFALIGVGINANNPPPTLTEPANHPPTSLNAETGRNAELRRLESRLIARLIDAMRGSGVTESDLADARAILHGVGEQIEARHAAGPPIQGVLVGLDKDGCAVIRVGDAEIVAPNATEIIHLDPGSETDQA